MPQYVCQQLSSSTPQTCEVWVEYSYLSSLAITKQQMIDIGSSLFVIAGIFIGFAIIASAAKRA